jgi:hypothetical protein
MSVHRCPHCHTELPAGDVAASFCGVCGRRIEGWTNLPSESQDGPLAGSQEATRQMEPTPSLLRIARVQREAREQKRRENVAESDSEMMRAIRRPSRAPWIAMVLVAVGGAVGGFLLMKQRQRSRRASIEPVVQAPANLPANAVTNPSANAATNPPANAVANPPANAATNPPANFANPANADAPEKQVAPLAMATPARKVADAKPHAKAAPPKLVPAHNKQGRAHRLTPLEVPVAVKRVKSANGGGLPHKRVDTDSRAAPSPHAQAPEAAPYPSVAVPSQPSSSQAMPSAPHEDAPAAQATADDPQTSTAQIDAEGVRLVVQHHLPQVHACYSRAFKESSPGGRIDVGFAINAAGRAESVRTEVNTTDSGELARCLEGRVREWQFPKPVGGDYELIYPFVFAPGS